jgi:hypothetical protein
MFIEYGRNFVFLTSHGLNLNLVYLQKNDKMLEIKKLVLTDDEKRPVAVQVDIKTFNKIEQLLEDYALGQFIEENDPSENLSLNEAKEAYRKMKK